MGSLVAKLLLPTISTLVFLPTISIAAKRRFHMEAMVYFFTMFFVAVRDPRFPSPHIRILLGRVEGSPRGMG